MLRNKFVDIGGNRRYLNLYHVQKSILERL
jgi:hypothetical protein